MTNQRFQGLIIRCRRAGDLYKKLLIEAEEEYKRRFGNYPGEVDDDWWIDTLHYCIGNTDLDQIIEHANLHKSRQS